MPYNVLFLCTGNSARSIMAEALLNYWGQGRLRAYSAGSQPKGQVHPFTLQTLERSHLPTDGLRSKSWNEFSRPGAPELHFVFTVCGNAAQEQCPHWPGQPMTAHWGVEDPAAAEGSEEERLRAFSAPSESSTPGSSCSRASPSNPSTVWRCSRGSGRSGAHRSPTSRVRPFPDGRAAA